ncbi:MAG TPA: SMP-30/gluconolactonase/LRE family protein [Rhizomicrobium sp.]|nr:SMP-30/gluconolactonase/LRE family protein [Rhizomicrobium sp.]
MDPVETIAVGNTLGEGIHWDVATQSAWWTDIQEKRIHRYDPAARKLDAFAMPERVGAFALMERGDRIVAALESGFALVDLKGGAPEWLGRPDAAVPGLRFNDGRVDRQGRFWAGTMEEIEPRAGLGNLYSVGPDGSVARRESGIAISNGLAWSPDGARMYFADSPLRTIYCYDFDTASGQISNRRVFARTPDGAHPDGAAVDSLGFLWSAHWGAGRIVRYRPDGTVDRALDVPVSQPTCVAFGGPDLDLMFVTSARDGLSAQALANETGAGNVFVYKMDVKGLPDRRYA